MAERETENAGASPGGKDSLDVEHRYVIESQDAVEHAQVHVEEEAPPRASDIRPSAAKRAERVVGLCFLIGGAASIGFMVAYIFSDLHTVWDVKWSNRWLGLSMAVAFLAMGAGITHWARRLMPATELTQEREPLPSPGQDREVVTDYVVTGADATGLRSRSFLRRTLLAALVPFGVAPLFLLRGMGSNMPFERKSTTVWRKGLRLIIYGTGTPVTPQHLATPGSLLTVIPEGYENDLDVLADATIQIIKTRPGKLRPPTRLDWVIDGIVAYSKICTHAGCPTGLYEDSTGHILCPCHQSTFDAWAGCQVIFGPASRPMPQLPLGLDPEGYLIALGDFPEPPGPGFWERG